MGKKKLAGGILGFALLFIAASLYLHGHTVAVLSPDGPIGKQEKGLMEVAILLSAIVIIPVYIMTVTIIWKYRETNKRPKKYMPEWDRSRLFESVWWGIPLLIITILSVITWRSSYALDPFRPLSSSHPPLTVQVIALDWKWLFIYPSQHVASVNEVPVPVDTPINFEITSDSVMNSFWIPQLGGQIYAMPGMATELHLMASKPGNYQGSSANISGSGFASMTFVAKAEPQAAFDSWVATSQQSKPLSLDAYDKLAQPSQNVPVTYYSQPVNGLYNFVVMKYMEPGAGQ